MSPHQNGSKASLSSAVVAVAAFLISSRFCGVVVRFSVEPLFADPAAVSPTDLAMEHLLGTGCCSS